MAARRKAIIGQFARSSIALNIEEMETWLNEQYQYRGELLAAGAAQIDKDAAALAVPVANEGLNVGRKVRFVKDTFQELALITALALTVTVTRGERAAHAQGAEVLDATGRRVGVLSAAMDAQAATLTFTMSAVERAFVVGEVLTVDEERLTVTALSSAITFTRPPGNADLPIPFEIRDDNGPYTLEYELDISEKIALVMIDPN